MSVAQTPLSELWRLLAQEQGDLDGYRQLAFSVWAFEQQLDLERRDYLEQEEEEDALQLKEGDRWSAVRLGSVDQAGEESLKPKAKNSAVSVRKDTEAQCALHVAENGMDQLSEAQLALTDQPSYGHQHIICILKYNNYSFILPHHARASAAKTLQKVAPATVVSFSETWLLQLCYG